MKSLAIKTPLIFLFLITIITAQHKKIPVEFSTGMYDMFQKNSAGLLTVKVDVHNNSERTIKYLTVEILAINKVGDVMNPELGSTLCRITGPIEPNDSYKTNLDCGTYYRGKVEKVKLRATSVEYMDGFINENPTEYYEHDQSMSGHGMSMVLIWTAVSVVGGAILALFL